MTITHYSDGCDNFKRDSLTKARRLKNSFPAVTVSSANLFCTLTSKHIPNLCLFPSRYQLSVHHRHLPGNSSYTSLSNYPLDLYVEAIECTGGLCSLIYYLVTLKLCRQREREREFRLWHTNTHASCYISVVPDPPLSEASSIVGCS